MLAQLANPASIPLAFSSIYGHLNPPKRGGLVEQAHKKLLPSVVLKFSAPRHMSFTLHVVVDLFAVHSLGSTKQYSGRSLAVSKVGRLFFTPSSTVSFSPLRYINLFLTLAMGRFLVESCKKGDLCQHNL